MTRALHVPAALAVAGVLLSAAPVLAQGNACQDGAKYFQTRQSIVDQLGKVIGKSKQVDPRQTCPIFTRMVSNGESGAKWLEGNKDWCQVPPQVAAGFLAEFEQMKKLKGQHCGAVAKIAQMEKAARQRIQETGPASLLGGGGLTSEFKIPQGAL